MDAKEQERYETWKAERRKHITGTDVASILGLSKFGGPMTVWLDKNGKLETVENDAMRAGKFLQDGILRAYSELNAIPIENADPWTLYLVQDFPLLGASLDARWANGDRRPVDAKNIRRRSEDYGEEGSDRIPIYYQTQLAVQMMATGAPYAELAVCFGGQEFVRYTVERDMDVENAIKEKSLAWWKRYVIGGEMPEADASDSCTDYIKERFRKAELGKIVEPTAEIVDWITQRKKAAAAKKEAEDLQTEAENKIKAFMGNAEEVAGLCTWKNNKDAVKTDWKEVAEYFRSNPDYGAIVDRHTEIKPGARVLRIK
jgi:putative phage-type endonuclease